MNVSCLVPFGVCLLSNSQSLLLSDALCQPSPILPASLFMLVSGMELMLRHFLSTVYNTKANLTEMQTFQWALWGYKHKLSIASYTGMSISSYTFYEEMAGCC